MTKDETLRLALEALESGIENKANSVAWIEYDCQLVEQAITAIKAALEAKDEPVAWMYPDDLKRFETSEAYAEAYSIEMVSPTQGETVPLYTTPPQRTWVGLTEEERYELLSKADWMLDPESYAVLVEAKLKEKNT